MRTALARLLRWETVPAGVALEYKHEPYQFCRFQWEGAQVKPNWEVVCVDWPAAKQYMRWRDEKFALELDQFEKKKAS